MVVVQKPMERNVGIGIGIGIGIGKKERTWVEGGETAR